MTRPGGIGLLRRIASLLVRGADAPFVLADLEDALERDLARGVPPGRARWRYARNVVGSALALWRARVGLRARPFSVLDVKIGLRMLRKQPGITVVAIFALGIGIPVGMAPWQAVNAIEAPLPVEEGGRIRLLRYWNVATSRPDVTTVHDYLRWREELTEFETLGSARPASYNLAVAEEIGEPVQGAAVTASTFDLLRVPPVLGRTLDPGDEAIGGPDVAVIGHDLWRVRFASDPDIVGRTVRIGDEPHTVVGVMPKGFLFPSRHQLWVPLREQTGTNPRDGLPLMVLGRLADEVSEEHAQARFSAISRRLAVENPEAYGSLRPEVAPSYMMFFGFPRGGLRATFDFYLAQAFALVLLGVACTNVGMLIFARTATRSTELAVRTALGASRARIVAQVFTECLVLAVLAAGVGLVVIDWIPIRLLALAGIADLLPYWVDPGVTPGAAVSALALAGFSAVIAGVAPALRLTGGSVRTNIQRAHAGASASPFGGLSGALIVADVAIAVMVVGLAVGIGDFVMDVRDTREGVGIDADEYLTVQLRLPDAPAAASRDASARRAFAIRLAETQRELVRRLGAEPGIRGVAVGDVLPRMDHPNRRIEVEGEEPAEGAAVPRARLARVDVDFFAQLGQPILAGRGFDSGDAHEDAAVAIANTSFVERVLGGRNPIGRRVRESRFDSTEWSPWYVIVGVVDHLGMHMLEPDQDEGIYLPAAPGEIHPVRMAVHVGDDPLSFFPRLREIARQVDPIAVVAAPVALDEVYEGDWYIAAGAVLGAGVLVTVLLAMAASGLYAILSFTVARRTREIGIRAALGARRYRIALTVIRRSLVQIGLGILIGLPLAGRIFFEIGESRAEATAWAAAGTLALGVGVMVLIGLAACTAPTLRALRIAPTEALRQDG